MIPFLTAADLALAWVLRTIVLITSAVVTLALVGLVISRFLFGYSLVGMHEASLLAAIWLYMAGAVLASRRNEHLVVDFLATSLPSSRAKAMHGLSVAILTLIIASFFSHWIWKMLAWGVMRPQTVPVLDLPLVLAQAPLALAAICAIIYALRDMARAVLQLTSSCKDV
ncbi:TRAP transporter small permease subunit (plasmid) [Brucella sp. 6810]|uniref:TRAP transporter small permease n=1 Tax=Brucella sp. 6810 TaxID=2769351 RepID=UPI00165B19F6|nr:TRAP transporter small permease subunit [Brucella sp. 6810]QNQ64474.1 TRAP transporter small permease subunit [Brucella sp. 6810]